MKKTEFAVGETFQFGLLKTKVKVSGKETWESNPWVFVYEFELIK